MKLALLDFPHSVGVAAPRSAKLNCGSALLRIAPASTFFLPLGSLSLERLEIAGSRLLQQFLQGTTVLQTTAHLGHQFRRNVQRRTTSFYATVPVGKGMKTSLWMSAVFCKGACKKFCALLRE